MSPKNALHILQKRCLERGEQEKSLGPQGIFHRLARIIAFAEVIYDLRANVRVREDKFHRLMSTRSFCLTLFNARQEQEQPKVASFAMLLIAYGVPPLSAPLPSVQR